MGIICTESTHPREDQKLLMDGLYMNEAIHNLFM